MWLGRGKNSAGSSSSTTIPTSCFSARLLLRELFDEVAAFEDPERALAAIGSDASDLVLLDANFGRGATNAAEGFHWLGEILKRDPHAVVVMITAHGGVNIAVEAMKRGATDFVSKPWSNERLLATVRTAAALRKSRDAVDTSASARSRSPPPPPAPKRPCSATRRRCAGSIR
jgi:DNA-binding NtrC family response regulator